MRPDALKRCKKPLESHHMIHFSADAYPLAEFVIMVAGHMGHDLFAGF
jgi:hypothetical protein